MDQKRDRLHFIDSLRGLAAIYVVLLHTLLVPDPNPPLTNGAAHQFVRFGITGVFLFFLISGFSLSMTMSRHERSPYPLLSYAVSRFFRIAPLFYALLILSALRDHYIFNQPVPVGDVLLDLSFLYNLVPGKQQGIVWASWTIGVEMLFYLIFPWLHRLGLTAQALVLASSLALFGAATALFPQDYRYLMFLGYFPLFIVGIWSFHLFDHLSKDQRRPGPGWALILAGGLFLVACSPTWLAEKMSMRLPIAIGYGLVIVGCGLVRPALLSSRLLTFYGRISYSLYLIHAILIYALSRKFQAIGALTGGDFGYWCDALFVLAAATPIAWVCYVAVERPGIRLGNRVLARATAYLAARRWRDPVGRIRA